MQRKQEEFLSSEKKEQSKKKRQRLSERRYLWLKAECAARFKYLWCKRPRNKPCDACLWKPAQRNEVRASKQLRSVASTETLNGNQALGSSMGLVLLVWVGGGMLKRVLYLFGNEPSLGQKSPILQLTLFIKT